MGQSLVKNCIHIVFSTKHRQPLIYSPFEEQLHAYLGGICKNLECFPIIVGGYTDHVHILCMLSKKMALMKLLETLKSNSSKWMKTKDKSLENFSWQNGYAAFSVNPDEKEKVFRYILNQKEHHKKITFQDEFLDILKSQDLEYDERFVWD
ncbi:MAG: IS200/IS605 family transposase [Bacteroidetes bacterium]|nr:IS200/IS605 family transposase [Bacteroidota bacterium]